MHRYLPLVLACIGLLGSASSALAANPRVDALGGASLVIDDDTTMLSLFNFGNPAGAAFLPRRNRLDLVATLGDRDRQAEFTTGPADVTGTTVDFFGNTLAPLTPFSRQSKTLSSSFDDWGPTGYGGLLYWLNDGIVLQVLPQADASRLQSSENPEDSTLFFGGGSIRGAWTPNSVLAIGAGISGGGGRSHGWLQPDWTPDAEGNSPDPRTEYDIQEYSLGGELGAGWHQAAVFDPKDALDIGVNLSCRRPAADRLDSLHADLGGGGPVIFSSRTQSYALPAAIQLQGVYDYQSVMDIGLVTGYENERLYQSESVNGDPAQPYYLSQVLENLDYEFSLRVRLPMARENDLRFGIVFNNRGFGHPYPEGQLTRYLPDGAESEPVILTVSSSIGIGAAVVPIEDLLFTLEYFLGSSKSRQSNEIAANSGYNRFNIGAEYAILKGLFLRAGYNNIQVTYQPEQGDSSAQTSVLTLLTERNVFSFGLGVGDESWHADLTLIADRLTRSPQGWTMLDKPGGITEVNQDTESSLSGMLGFTWKF